MNWFYPDASGELPPANIKNLAVENKKMNFESVVWVYLPIVIGLLVSGGSFYLTTKRSVFFGFVTTFQNLVLISIAIYILAQIVTRLYPSYTPHLIILVSVIFLVVQNFLKKKVKCLPIIYKYNAKTFIK